MKLIGRFQFSLRTLFIIVTMFATFCGYDMNWIRQRNEIRESTTSFAGDRRSKNAPCGLWLFGEPGESVIYPHQYDPRADANLRRLFPEAEINYVFVEYDRLMKTHE